MQTKPRWFTLSGLFPHNRANHRSWKTKENIIRISKVTTKTSDCGYTLLGCQLVQKGHPAIDLLGDLDELNCHLGNIKGCEGIQDFIFEISAAVYKGEDWVNSQRYTEEMEYTINTLNDGLQPLKEFIRPSGNIHLARSVCRRCERKAWALDSSKNYNIYLNRLSDFLFVLARTLSKEEQYWSRS